MRRTRRTGYDAAAEGFRPSLLGLPGSFLQQLISKLSCDSKLALRATCKQCMWEVEQASGSTLQLRLCSRIPSIHSIHAVNMLAHVSILDTAAASRGAVSVGWRGSVQQASAALPSLHTAHLNSSQASLVELLLHAAPQLSRVELSVTSVTPTVVRLLARLPALASLDLKLGHPGWMKACAGLGSISQLQQLTIAGRGIWTAAGCTCIRAMHCYLRAKVPRLVFADVQLLAQYACTLQHQQRGAARPTHDV
ncbi:hypothetical protein COO60DRAFT_739086 [Scenedesmus sp. NREL 46B-D3]|nr:hypothetical protein COO60DRAFT_739086 [Scenedesmus sp. NREL 46B-D3]